MKYSIIRLLVDDFRCRPACAPPSAPPWRQPTGASSSRTARSRARRGPRPRTTPAWQTRLPDVSLTYSLIRKIAVTEWVRRGIGDRAALAIAMRHSVETSELAYNDLKGGKILLCPGEGNVNTMGVDVDIYATDDVA